ncbi:AAA family ATPase [Nostoc sp. UCD121]|uniref:trifunctional serine/threonine-protein kinase/ATP-binding protein/sensor histidine kinase n=1 Tax=unclassified Nostoc TaxID=2593658 RepID=UPI0016293EFB|nr:MULTISPECIES: ATP-binding sensor histidine kinase [unclassified Nostoc]MBC1224387.1 AAA family ATPase [Nostoc sp. UCD120]MBC1278834.1 AAA family ATPase [Nostoc sp. UCD121]
MLTSSSISISGYDLNEMLHEGDDTIIYRAISQLDKQPVILKILKADYPSIDAIACLKHEYKITENLDLEGVVKVLRLETHENRLAIVFEDFNGYSLKQLLITGKQELKSFIKIAIQLAQALVSVHTCQIIHKDIKPANIIINPETGVVKLTDFSIASRLDKETTQLANPNQLEGTLVYISPEQTGRMNRTLDYRSDFYSLGVTFYEILTGQLPFQSYDPLELVYCHIAKQPTEIETLNPEIPTAISSIVNKLMAKNAEDRYQTAKGLLADLEICQEQLETTGEITDFIPGRLDVLSQLLIPQKLYGRETQVNSLLEAFERVSQGSRELILVSGYSGIGKSSVVNEVNKPITRAKGFFISGKFDQFQRNIPYASLIQALSSLMRQLLTENATKLETWRSKILAAVKSHGQVIIDVIPEVELIIGKQPEVVKLSAVESENRFNRVFSQFIQVFAKKKHPLVIFLDDLQWADSATLKLIKLLISDKNTKYLLLIGAYRDNEVSITHPLMAIIEEITQDGTVVNNIILQALSLEDFNSLIADTLHQNPEPIKSLVDLLYNKTGGNPFFLTQILLVLYQENLFKFNFEIALWQWDIEKIQAIGITDKSIVELIASRIINLSPATQEMLKLAACVGNRFSLDILSIVSAKSITSTARELYSALQCGLILPLSDTYRIPLAFEQEESIKLSFDSKQISYKFLHDRIQQAAYSLIPENSKQGTHLKIGQLLLQQTPTESLAENILDIVNQLNVGLDLLTQQSEKYELAKLNLLAGKKAKAATAYESSGRYLNIGLELLTVDSWNQFYDLTLNLYIEATEAEYLNGHFENAHKLVDIALSQANSILDKVKLHEIKMLTYMAHNQMPEVLEIGVKALKELGVILPKKPTKLNVLSALIQTKLTLIGKPIEDLALLPEMSDPYKLAAMQILLQIVPAASQAGSFLFVLAVFAMVRLSVKYGKSAVSAYAYAAYGTILSDKFNQVETGYSLGKLAIELLSNTNTNSLKATVYFVHNGTIRFYKEHIKDTIAPLLEGMQSGLELGNIENAGYCAVIAGYHSLLSGENLELVDKKILSYVDLMQKLRLESLAAATSVFRQVTLNLQAKSLMKTALVGEAFDEITMASEVTKNYSFKGFYYGSKTILCYLFEEYELAIENAIIAEETHTDNVGLLIYTVNNFYYSLALISFSEQALSLKKKQYLKQVAANQQQMKKWAKQAPCNFQHKYELVEAEKARVLGKLQVAIDLYDCAIAGAKKNGYIQEEALGNELAAKFYMGLGKEKIAKTYMTEAYYGYIHWGAIAKVQDLDERYNNLIIRTQNVKQLEIDVTRTIATTKINYSQTTSNSNGVLDLATVIKASQAISSEIVLDKLLDALLNIILENAAAQKGCLILAKDNELFIEAITTTANSSIILQSTPIQESQDIPISIVQYVARTQENLVINDVISQSLYQSDVYIKYHQPKSILCSPIFYQGKFIGLLYLENKLIAGAFTSERVNILNLITSQAAISLENSRLYQQAQDYAKQLEFSLSELKQMQLHLVQSEKMSTLGNLVSGIAHEINNPIGFIIGNLKPASEYVKDLLKLISLYQHYYPQPVVEITETVEEVDLEYVREDLPKLIASMQEGINRIYDVSISLRTFSRGDTQTTIPCNLYEVIESTILILKHRLKASHTRPAIEVVKNYDDIPLVRCFPGQLSQVFMNLLANAIDALEESNIGRNIDEIKLNPSRITISTKLNEDQKSVLIRIKDNGVGMNPEVKQKIFDHLFTTKPVGKGTGLGLAIALQIIIEKHGGSIEVNSALGQGTEFVIQLPI